MANIRVTAPTVEPVTLAQARAHMGVTAYGSPAAHPDDSVIEMLVSAAREWVEDYLQRGIGTQVRREVLDAFPAHEIYLPGGPVHSIDSVSYVDDNDNVIVLTAQDYYLDNINWPNQLMPATDVPWPVAKAQANAVQVQYTCGYTNGASPDDYPTEARLKLAVLLLAAHWYINREQTAQTQEVRDVPMGIYDLLQPLRLTGV
jgi:uncharacterized phiE125 gp8 family phage protein